MYCGRCGSKVKNNELYCPNCGARLRAFENQPKRDDYGRADITHGRDCASHGQYAQPSAPRMREDKGGLLWFLFGLLTGWIALIAYFMLAEHYPIRSQSILKGFVTAIVVVALMFLLMICILTW
jgi:hypothetical protein